MIKKIQKTGLLLLLILSNFTTNAQTLEDSLDKITTKVANDLKKSPNVKIAIFPFKIKKENEKDIAEHILDEFYSLLSDKGVKTIDRAITENYEKEHRMNENGLFDPKTVKKFGMITMSDAYGTGKIYKFGTRLHLQFRVTDTQTMQILSQSSAKIPIDMDMAEFLGIKKDKWEKDQKRIKENKSQNPNCNSLNIGDYWFENNTNIKSEVRIKPLNSHQSGYSKKLVLMPRSKTGFKDLLAGSYTYIVIRVDRLNIVGQSNVVTQGNFTVKKCGSYVQKIGTKQNSVFNSNTSKNLHTVQIINPNFYARKIVFSNRNGNSESITVSANSKGEIQLPKDIYRFTSFTLFTKTEVQQSTINLKSNKVINLVRDNYN